mmetsp:Transcript_64398/g.73927  ORF Transcript_64398/g.73927 Transcript_64398/m.73927 type:complete len:110 (-) Transcript_64398:34-363(-)
MCVCVRHRIYFVVIASPPSPPSLGSLFVVFRFSSSLFPDLIALSLLYHPALWGRRTKENRSSIFRFQLSKMKKERLFNYLIFLFSFSPNKEEEEKEKKDDSDFLRFSIY